MRPKEMLLRGLSPGGSSQEKFPWGIERHIEIAGCLPDRVG